ncbi:unnamed protein product [Coregonus sp. 'balchen']|nr:unnamed protein product [Coregonus sp. 'balchen']
MCECHQGKDRQTKAKEKYAAEMNKKALVVLSSSSACGTLLFLSLWYSPLPQLVVLSSSSACGFLGKRGLAHPLPVVTAERARLNDREATQFILDPGITVAATPLTEYEELQQTLTTHTPKRNHPTPQEKKLRNLDIRLIQKLQPIVLHPKRHKELSLRELQVNIIDAVTAKINERADGLEKMTRENTSKIVDLETSLNHAYKSIEELKRANTATSDKCTAQEKTIANMQERLSEAERYRRRWGLRLYGVPGDHGEHGKGIARNQGMGAYYRGIGAFFADGK